MLELGGEDGLQYEEYTTDEYLALWCKLNAYSPLLLRCCCAYISLSAGVCTHALSMKMQAVALIVMFLVQCYQ